MEVIIIKKCILINSFLQYSAVKLFIRKIKIKNTCSVLNVNTAIVAINNCVIHLDDTQGNRNIILSRLKK